MMLFSNVTDQSHAVSDDPPNSKTTFLQDSFLGRQKIEVFYFLRNCCACGII